MPKSSTGKLSVFWSLTLLFAMAGCSVLDSNEPIRNITSATIPIESSSPAAPMGETNITETAEPTPESEETVMADVEKKIQADIVSVEISGDPDQYQFSVGISSPDTGCEQYADWWEVLSEDGELIYRRILDHSHVNEQPFTRSGGPVGIRPDQIVLVRAHMNQAGYGGKSMKGSVDSGFEIIELPPDFSPEIEIAPPLPTGCNF